MDSLRPRIDFHAHYIPSPYSKLLASRGIDKPDGYPLPRWDLSTQLKNMELLGITFAAMTISSPHAHFGDAGESIEVVRASNEEGLSMARKYPDKLGIIATLPLPEIDASVSEIEFAVREGAVAFVMPTHARGVYLGDEKLEPVFECLNKYKAVLCFHPTTPSVVPPNVSPAVPRPLHEFLFDTTRAITNMIVNGIVTRYPNIRYIIPHAGAFLPLTAQRMSQSFGVFHAEKGICISDILRSFHYDLAGYVVPNHLYTLLNTTDTSHIVYGSDGPHTPTETMVQLAKELDETTLLTDEDRDSIYINNAKKLLAI